MDSLRLWSGLLLTIFAMYPYVCANRLKPGVTMDYCMILRIVCINTEINSHVKTAPRTCVLLIFKLITDMYIIITGFFIQLYQSQYEGPQKEDFSLPLPMFKKNFDSSPTTRDTKS